MNKIINSPIVVAIFVVVSLFILKAQTKPKAATEIRGAYDEIIKIAEEAGNDREKSKAIRAFAQEMASQLREGFQAGFRLTDKDKKESNDAKFLRLKDQVVISEPELLSSQQKNIQNFIYRISNNLEIPIKQIRINCEYYRNNVLIDVENKYIHEVKVLAAGDNIAVKGVRFMHGNLNDEAAESMKFDRVKLIVTDFNFVD